VQRHIVQIAPPWYQVPPDGYGGIELVVGLLVDGLRGLGQQVTLFAAEGSPGAETPAPSHWGDALGQPDERLRELGWAMRILERLTELDGIDLVHDHVGHATLLSCALAARVPVVHTAHGPMLRAYRDFYASLRGRVAMLAISDSQRRVAPELPWFATVHNAVDVDALRVGAQADGDDPYLVWMARLNPDKGQHVAIEVARRAGMRLVLAGKVDESPAAQEYYATSIEPRVDGDRVVHITNAAGEEKAKLLAGATALIAPLCWEEPFGLALVEAMASGAPAIAFPRGAAPELIEEGVTGFVVPDADAMVAAVAHISSISRTACAERARSRFSARAMAQGYLRAYEGVLTRPGLAGHRAAW